MQQTRTQALFGVHFARRLWRLTRLYWTSRDAAKGGLLLALAVALELGTVYGNFVLADAQRRIYDGLQDRVAAAFTWVFLDDATAALDEETERRAYAVLTERLPDATVVSVAHRPAVAQYHTRRWTLVPQGDGRSELQAA